ncbi:AAA family ATPase [Actinosynnema sp. CS-041913]|uniref:AAA family ATPase n=1 Tax=Actinosynnema sp. CS-041913 TaxID=3239917 RepID=UPI003D91E890
MNPGKVIVLTGPPGAGKSTVAKLLADALSPSVHLHSDDFWRYIRQGWLAPYRPEAHRQNEVVVDVVAQAAFGYAAGGYQVVCDGIVGPWFLEPFRAAATRTGLDLHYLVLRPDEATTVRRAVERGGEALTDPHPVRSLHRQFADLGPFERHALDSTGQDPDATASAALRAIEGGAFHLA